MDVVWYDLLQKHSRQEYFGFIVANILTLLSGMQSFEVGTRNSVAFRINIGAIVCVGKLSLVIWKRGKIGKFVQIFVQLWISSPPKH